MRSTILTLALVILGSSAAIAQQSPGNPALIVPKLDVSLGYNYMRANAPPGGCPCFSLNGGYLAAGFHIVDWLSLEAEGTGGRANNISLLGQNLNLITVAAGPRVSLSGHRFVPFGEALFGVAHGSDSYFPTATSFTTSASSFALSAGGGLDYSLNHRYAIRAVDVQYLRTAFPNGNTNTQNHLMIGAGLVVKFGGHMHWSPAPVPREEKRPSEISFTCSSIAPTVKEGDLMEVSGHAFTSPDQLALDYAWTTDSGTIIGSGRMIAVKTEGLAPGDYHVKGKASLLSSPATFAECDVPFHVKARPAAVAANTSPTPADIAKSDAVFHENVQDALFDYDSAEIRPDAKVAIEHAGKFLTEHPDIQVLIEGYADDRGSAEYNLGLGAQRASAARTALMGQGIPPERLKIISYGKEAQVCVQQTEQCWQQNRRAAFSMHH